MPMISISNSRLYYLDRGQGIPIILLHGFLGNAFMWAPQVAEFENDFRLIAPDIWGHGNSGNLPDGTSNLAEVAQQILNLLDILAVEKFILVGHSVGGMLSGELAVKVPDRVIALALIDTHLGQEPSKTRKFFLNLISVLEDHEYFPLTLIEELKSLFFAQNDSNSIVRLKTAFHNDLSRFERDRIAISIVPLGRMIFNRRDMTTEFSLINAASTIVVCGQYDIVRPPIEAQAMASRIGCSYVEVPYAAHTPNLENADFVTKTLREFIYNIIN
ncbi:alpha/beta hydrolase [Klebsiella aerogenes]|uniref:alpha/beta fold hydrolase n=1 Tax=Klebsiella aerogenes TaxID=548 RepID=UPI0028DED780|nr:alpha/beta hydrolase [Klebsiella aerogenes]MDT8880998.1 alpha/beta hydrolase [Klebsiella aerogenes]